MLKAVSVEFRKQKLTVEYRQWDSRESKSSKKIGADVENKFRKWIGNVTLKGCTHSS